MTIPKLSSMTIKARVMLLSILVIFCLLLMTIFKIVSDNNQSRLYQADKAISDINAGMLMLRRNEKDFLSRLAPKYIDKFSQNHVLLQENLDNLIELLSKATINNDQMVELKVIFQQYHDVFIELTDAQKERGLNPKDGLYGGLRKAVHEVEDIVGKLGDYELMKDMLMLRRREKDFMLRWDEKYLAKFDNDVIVMQQALNNSQHSYVKKQQVKKFMASYVDQFHQFYDISKHVGLTSKSGNRGKMRNIIHQSEEFLAEASIDMKDVIQNQLSRNQILYLILSVATLLILIFVSLLLARSIVDPINELRNLMVIAKDDRDLSVRSSISSNDEVGEMAMAFNEMLSVFAEIMMQVQMVSKNLSSSSQQLNAVVDNTSNSLNHQRIQNEQVASAMSEISASIQNVSVSISDSAETAKTSHTETTKGKTTVAQAVSSIRELASEIEETTKIVTTLDEDSQNISTVLDVIKSIAEQTNLLALNAAIEAARAGEQGRGFAVVADEVRSLAARTQESTAEINSIIEDLQSNSSKAVESMNKNRVRAVETVDVALSANSALDAITASVHLINEKSAHIAKTSEQQAVATTQVNNSINQISTMTEATLTESEKTKSSSDMLATLAEQLQGMVTQFKMR